MTRRAPHKRLLDGWRLLSRGWKATVGFVASLGVILGFVFHPPWAGGGSSSKSDTTTMAVETCPSDVVGQVTKLTVDPQAIPLAAYWQLHPGSRPPNASPDRGRTLGRVVRFGFQASNYPAKPLTITWWIVNRRGEPVPPDLTGHLEASITPGSCKTTKVTRDFWAELPARAGKYRVQIELDAGSEQLDLARTEIFAVTSRG